MSLRDAGHAYTDYDLSSWYFMFFSCFLIDGTIWDPGSSLLNEVEIIGFKANVMDVFPEIFVPDTPEADPDNYPGLQDLVDYVVQQTNQQTKELFKRDKEGNLLMKPTGKGIKSTAEGHEATVKEVKIMLEG